MTSEQAMDGIVMSRKSGHAFSLHIRLSIQRALLLCGEYREGEMEDSLMEVLELGFLMLEFNARERGRRQFGFPPENEVRDLAEVEREAKMREFLKYREEVEGYVRGKREK